MFYFYAEIHNYSSEILNPQTFPLVPYPGHHPSPLMGPWRIHRVPTLLQAGSQTLLLCLVLILYLLSQDTSLDSGRFKSLAPWSFSPGPVLVPTGASMNRIATQDGAREKRERVRERALNFFLTPWTLHPPLEELRILDTTLCGSLFLWSPPGGLSTPLLTAGWPWKQLPCCFY